jgi:hypothetical protein
MRLDALHLGTGIAIAGTLLQKMQLGLKVVHVD